MGLLAKAAIYFVSLMLLAACNGEILESLPSSGELPSGNFCPTERLPSGKCPVNNDTSSTASWDFLTAGDYAYNSNYVEISAGQARLKTVDQTFSGTDFNSGTHVGTYFDTNSGRVKMLDKLHSSLDARTILPSRVLNLVGYWKMDENFDDAVGLYDGEAEGDLSLSVSSKVGSGSGNFDGSNDSLDISAAKTTFDRSKGSISFWANRKFTTVPSFHRHLLRFQVDADNLIGLYVRGSGDRLRISYKENGNLHFADANITWQEALPLNTWAHIALRWDLGASYFKLYINQVEVASVTVSNPLLGTFTELEIGYSQSSNQAFEGLIDELVIWNEPITTQEIRQLYILQSQHYNELSSNWTPHWDNIVGYWKMDGNWQDSSGKGNHGTPRSAAAYSEGKIGSQAASFSASSTSGTLPDLSATLNGSTNFSISFWLRGDSSLSNWDRVIEDTPGTGILITKTGNTGQLRIGNWGVTGSDISCNSCVDNQGNWYHHFVSVSSGKYYWFLNGELKLSGNTVGGLSLPGSTNIGGQNGGSNIWSGSLDDLAFWRVGLAASDVKQIYNRQKQKYAGHYDSPVVDLGSSGSWTNINVTTSLPFAKEIVAQGVENTSQYEDLSADLRDGLVGYWNFNELAFNGVGGEDIEDKTIYDNHGVESGGVAGNQRGILSQGIYCDGSDDQIDFGDEPEFNFSSTSDFTISVWLKLSPVLDSQYDQILGKKDNKSAVNTGYALYLGANNKILMNISDGTNAVEATTATTISEKKWHHFTITADRDGDMQIYKDGSTDGAAVDISGVGDIDEVEGFMLCASGFNSRQVQGYVDNLAIWNRLLTANEIQQLYRRSANRVSYQVKSCIDSSCNCKSYSIAPVGSTTDCDGDGTLNTADSSDIHAAEFMGPGGNGSTSYSEVFNRAGGSTTFNCSNNTSDSDNDICLDDEIALSGDSNTASPSFTFSDMATSAAPTNNRYFQYRISVEAEENIACAGQPCLPELTSVEIGPTSRYYGGSPVVKPSNPISFSDIGDITFTEGGSCSLTYQLSTDDSTYYYHNGTNWVAAGGEVVSESTEGASIKSNITSFIGTAGPGSLYLKAFMTSDTSQACSLDDVSVTVPK